MFKPRYVAAAAVVSVATAVLATNYSQKPLYEIGVKDVNNDGELDLVVATKERIIPILSGDGFTPILLTPGHSFSAVDLKNIVDVEKRSSAKHVTSLGRDYERPDSLAMLPEGDYDYVDFNNDGYQDIVVFPPASVYKGTVVFLGGSGNVPSEMLTFPFYGSDDEWEKSTITQVQSGGEGGTFLRVGVFGHDYATVYRMDEQGEPTHNLMYGAPVPSSGDKFTANDPSFTFSKSQMLSTQLRGQADVSEGGSLRYILPIDLPSKEGVAMPSLSIMYDSDLSEGLVGLGGALNGSKAIWRCRDLAPNNRIIDYNNDDQICSSDGRLIPIKGSGGAGTVYVPEVDNGVVYTWINANQWKVELVDGSLQYYGSRGPTVNIGSNTNHPGFGSPVVVQKYGSTVKRWLLSQTVSTFGNQTNYFYESVFADDAEVALTRIAYGNSAAGAVQVDLGYVSRTNLSGGSFPQLAKTYADGDSSSNSILLSSISIRHAGNYIASYGVNYRRTAKGRNIINTVRRTDGVAKPSEVAFSHSADVSRQVKVNNGTWKYSSTQNPIVIGYDPAAAAADRYAHSGILKLNDNCYQYSFEANFGYQGTYDAFGNGFPVAWFHLADGSHWDSGFGAWNPEYHQSIYSSNFIKNNDSDIACANHKMPGFEKKQSGFGSYVGYRNNGFDEASYRENYEKQSGGYAFRNDRRLINPQTTLAAGIPRFGNFNENHKRNNEYPTYYDLNNDGLFTAGVWSALNSGWKQGEFNGDGFQDRYKVVNRSGRIYLEVAYHTGRHENSYSHTHSIALPAAIKDTKVVFADINADGIADVIDYGNQSSVNNGSGIYVSEFGRPFVRSVAGIGYINNTNTNGDASITAVQLDDDRGLELFVKYTSGSPVYDTSKKDHDYVSDSLEYRYKTLDVEVNTALVTNIREDGHSIISVGYKDTREKQTTIAGDATSSPVVRYLNYGDYGSIGNAEVPIHNLNKRIVYRITRPGQGATHYYYSAPMRNRGVGPGGAEAHRGSVGFQAITTVTEHSGSGGNTSKIFEVYTTRYHHDFPRIGKPIDVVRTVHASEPSIQYRKAGNSIRLESFVAGSVHGNAVREYIAGTRKSVSEGLNGAVVSTASAPVQLFSPLMARASSASGISPSFTRHNWVNRSFDVNGRRVYQAIEIDNLTVDFNLSTASNDGDVYETSVIRNSTHFVNHWTVSNGYKPLVPKIYERRIFDNITEYNEWNTAGGHWADKDMCAYDSAKASRTTINYIGGSEGRWAAKMRVANTIAANCVPRSVAHGDLNGSATTVERFDYKPVKTVNIYPTSGNIYAVKTVKTLPEANSSHSMATEVTTEYFNNGLVKSVTSSGANDKFPAARVTSFKYTTEGYLKEQTQGELTTTYAEFNENGLPQAVTAPDGSVSKLWYSPSGAQYQTQSATGFITTNLTLPASAKDEFGISSLPVNTAYIVGKLDNSGSKAFSFVDNQGRTLGSATYGADGQYRYSLNQYSDPRYNRVTGVTDIKVVSSANFSAVPPVVATMQYYADGQLTRSTSKDEDGNTLVKTIKTSGTTELGLMGQNPVSVTSAVTRLGTTILGGSYTYTNALGQVTHTVQLKQGVTSEQALPNSQVYYAYDAEGNNIRRLTKLPDGSYRAVDYHYDDAGNLVREHDWAVDKGNGRGYIDYTYNVFGEVIKQNYGGENHLREHFYYDALGRQFARVVVNGDSVNGYESYCTEYNGQGRGAGQVRSTVHLLNTDIGGAAWQATSTNTAFDCDAHANAGNTSKRETTTYTAEGLVDTFRTDISTEFAVKSSYLYRYRYDGIGRLKDKTLYGDSAVNGSGSVSSSVFTQIYKYQGKDGSRTGIQTSNGQTVFSEGVQLTGNAIDKFGNYTKVYYANRPAEMPVPNLQTEVLHRQYSPHNGALINTTLQRCKSSGALGSVGSCNTEVSKGFDYDSYGNLAARWTNDSTNWQNTNLTVAGTRDRETFSYNGAQGVNKVDDGYRTRLTSHSIDEASFQGNNSISETYSYDSAGNMLRRVRYQSANKVADYSYGYAEYSRINKAYDSVSKQDLMNNGSGWDGYNYSGALIRGKDYHIRYDGAMRASQVDDLRSNTQFSRRDYHYDGHRYYAMEETPSTGGTLKQKQTLFIGELQIHIDVKQYSRAPSATAEVRYALATAGGEVSFGTGGSNTQWRIQVMDALGTTLAAYSPLMGGSTSDRVDLYFYSAFGERLDGSTHHMADRLESEKLFTGHALMGSLPLIHMQGRIYDPRMARFTRPDPFIQAPRNHLSYNRYSYVFNNPLTFNDPSGFVSEPPSEGFKAWQHQSGDGEANEYTTTDVDDSNVNGKTTVTTTSYSLESTTGGTKTSVAINYSISTTYDFSDECQSYRCEKYKSGISFDDYFSMATGDLSIDWAINEYHAQTGNTLTKRELERMFFDPYYSKNRLMESESLHKDLRDILNTKSIASVPTGSSDFKQLEDTKSILHSPISTWFRSSMNSKWVGPNGHMESVFKPNGQHVWQAENHSSYDRTYMGTFNFFGPNDASAHTMTDVLPWISWRGN